jgi:hypothetical protein
MHVEKGGFGETKIKICDLVKYGSLSKNGLSGIRQPKFLHDTTVVLYFQFS